MNKPVHITYLFGAGASYNSMPIVSELNGDLERLSAHINDHGTRIIPRYKADNENQSYLADEGPEYAEWMVEPQMKAYEMLGHINSFATVDTLAKYWTATKNNNLLKLKEVINLYFAMRHFCPHIALANQRNFFDEKRRKEIFKPKFRFDPRYDALIAGLVSAKDGSHHDRVSYISYNYDLELEQSLAKFGLNTPTGGDGEIPIYHVNGHCTNLYGKMAKDEEHTVKAILEDGGAIKYAWEADETSKEEIRTRLAKTTHLVVIGYSFPVFNREIDRQILAATNLKKIYIQDLPEALPGIENRVRALLGNRVKPQTQINSITKIGKEPIHIETINTVDQFHIPFELI